ncbi:MAG TPA: TetR/AcrR family transcriptional regulator [Terriglobia bacterium]|nr:TetR/AcrR family transcriptional regulator [Terriglobia bacterium]
MSRKTRSRPDGFAARKERGARTRTAIMQAAERIFAEAGFGGARTEAIAAQAGVNKALLYYYFPSKDGLYRAILEDHLKEFQRQVVDALSTEGPARAKLLSYVSTHFDFISARPYYPRLVQRLMMTGGKPLERLAREFYVPVHRKLVSVIDRGISDGEFRRVDSHHTVLSLVALISFYFSSAPILNAISRTDPYATVHLARRKAEVLKFIRYALFKKRKERLA